ncbi:MAG: hypothetical protein CMH54_07355 [Myxococcales bacterium]|nr:hypothetical protein [Myxococcales bacterium]
MPTIHFDRPFLLLLLVLIWAIHLGLGGWMKRRSWAFRTARFDLARSVARSFVRYRVLTQMPRLFRSLALSFFIIALARPQLPDMDSISGEGVDIMFALDMSGSMRAVDIPRADLDRYIRTGKEPPNRFEMARQVLKKFVKERDEDRIGLIVFGEQAFLKFPLTLDYDAVMTNLEGLILDDGLGDHEAGCGNGCTISGRGTAIGDTLARAYRRLSATSQRNRARGRVLVLITDGKNQGGQIEPQTMIEKLREHNLAGDRGEINVFTILIGDPSLTWVPTYDMFGNLRYAKPDQPIPTDKALLEEIASNTNGKFWETPDEKTFKAAFRNLEKTIFQHSRPVQGREMFLYPLFLGLLFLLSEGLLAALVLRRFP